MTLMHIYAVAEQVGLRIQPLRIYIYICIAVLFWDALHLHPRIVTELSRTTYDQLLVIRSW